MNRRDKILKLIVEDFIKNAQPIGSKTLIETYNLDFSSATIRSEMNNLEKDGYIEKTHTSSGRVPSSKGYRYYVEKLREKSVDEQFKNRMQLVLDQKVKSVDGIIKESCEILSEMTNLASIVLGPNSKEEKLISLQIVPLSSSSATCVFITDRGYVENKTFAINSETKISDIENCIKLLNDRLKGTSISQLVEKMQLIKPLLSDFIIDHDVIYRTMLEAFVGFAKDRLSAYGKNDLYSQPEFANDANKLKMLIEMFDNPTMFRKFESENDICIHIGGENDENNDVSIITAKLDLPNDNKGNIAIVGPKRMDYDKVVSNIEYLVNELETYFKKIYIKGE